jgi:stress response protein YsnF
MVKAPPPRRAGELPVPGSSPGAQRTPRESAPDNPEVISLGEETVTVSKRLVEREGVRVRLVTDEVADIARASLQSERLKLERIAVGREVEHAPSVREENGVTVIPVLEEIVVVEKRLVLKEELRIRRVAEVREVSEPVTVRRQRAEIERSPAAENSAAEPSPIKTGLKGNQS